MLRRILELLSLELTSDGSIMLTSLMTSSFAFLLRVGCSRLLHMICGAVHKVVGFNSWHYNNREVGAGAFGAPCDMNVGAIAMPTVVSKLAEMGREIKRNSMKEH